MAKLPWLKLRTDLEDSAEVLHITSMLSSDPEFIAYVGESTNPLTMYDRAMAMVMLQLFRIWTYANTHGFLDGEDLIVFCHADVTLVSRSCTFAPGFLDAMRKVGWLADHDTLDAVVFPRFRRWNCGSDYRTEADKQAKRRELAKLKEAHPRRAGVAPLSRSCHPGDRPVTCDFPKRGEEREESNTYCGREGDRDAREEAPKKPRKKPANPRPRNPIFDALSAEFFGGKHPKSKASLIGKAAAELAEQGLTHQDAAKEIARRRAVYLENFTTTDTMMAVVNQWAACEQPRSAKQRAGRKSDTRTTEELAQQRREWEADQRLQSEALAYLDTIPEKQRRAAFERVVEARGIRLMNGMTWRTFPRWVADDIRSRRSSDGQER